jgi:hypothetical protein
MEGTRSSDRGEGEVVQDVGLDCQRQEKGKSRGARVLGVDASLMARWLDG